MAAFIGTSVTSDGKFRGLRTDSGAVVFRGIVYARYTRFGLPEEVDYAEGEVYDAREWGCVCPQDLTHLRELLGPDSGLEMREGELCLTVTVPPGAEAVNVGSAGESEAPRKAQGSLPVMVWIHGGSYLTGGSEDHRYDVSPLAEAGNVVVVKISYRLGAEGYLRMPERDAANLGLEDQKTALRWIRRHIASFGGDPDNVTLWGQSAGAHSVASLIASADDVELSTNVPRFGGEPLFHRAILQSPPLGVKMTSRDAEKLCGIFLKRLAQRTGQGAAETASLEDFIAVQTTMKNRHFALPFMPVLPDCTAFPGRPEGENPGCPASEYPLSGRSASAPAGTDSSGKGESVLSFSEVESRNRLPDTAGTPFKVLLYCNRDDASVYSRKILGRTLYRTPFGALLTKIITARVFVTPAEKYLRKLRRSGVESSLFRFSWHPEGNPLGCCHSIELPFLLGRPEDWAAAEMLRGITEEEWRCYSEMFKSLWSEFARSGRLPEVASD